MVLDADARVQYASPNAVSALHRVGINANAVGLRLAELGLQRRVRCGRPSSATSPSSRRSTRPPRSRCSTRCIPILAGGARHRRRAAAARRQRAAPAGPAAAVEGRHHPGDPPPGEEQPADDLVAAAPAGPAHGVATRPRRRIGRVGAAHPHHRPRPRDAVARGRRRRRLRRDRPARCCAWPRRACSRPTGRCGSGSQGDGGKLPAAHGHAAVGRADRAAAERRRPRLPRPQAARSTSCRCWSTTTTSSTVQVIDDGIGVPDDFSIEQATASA